MQNKFDICGFLIPFDCRLC